MTGRRASVVDELEQFTVRSRDDWRAWLDANHARSRGVWVVTFKKRSGGPHVPYAEVVEEALCFGWIDGRGRTFDDERTQLLVTPRKPTSNWSALNKDRVARLSAAGAIAPAGIAAIDTARANGTWDALNDVDQLIEPDDLRSGLDADPSARRHWDAFSASAKRLALEWVHLAKRPDTRARRIHETVEHAVRGERVR